MKNLDRFARSLSAILLIGAPNPGYLLALALAIEPTHFIGAAIGWLAASACVRALGMIEDFRAANVRANGILAGIAASWLASPTPLPFHAGLIMIVLSAVAASLLAAALSRAMLTSPAPPLSAAFALTFGVLLMLLPTLASAAVLSEPIWPYPADWLGWVDSFLRSMGMIVFSPRPETGLLVAAALTLWSSLYTLHGLVGWVAGVIASIILAKFGFSWLWLLSAHNGFIAAMLLGAFFHLPGRASLLLSALAGVSAAILALFVQTAFTGTAWAFQPIPALATVWVAILALSSREQNHPLVTNSRPDLPPEQAWREWRLKDTRFGELQPLVCVPLAGVTSITQSFDGPISHRADWRHGLDFEYASQPWGPGVTIFGAPVYCPAAGVVESVCRDISDNPLGAANYSQNWGNHIILRMDQGGWLLLGHLAQYSPTVVAGQRVRLGEIVATVGNSGRSPVPHLHMHVQASAVLGAPTRPFRLANYLVRCGENEMWLSSGVPTSGTLVSAALPNTPTFQAVTSLAPGVGLWRLALNRRVPAQFSRLTRSETLKISLDPAGRHILIDSSGGSLQLSADLDALRAYEYRAGGKFLQLLRLALPLLPYCAEPGLVWSDYVDSGSRSVVGRLKSPVAPYAGWRPTPVQMRCLKSPEMGGDEMIIETSIVAPSPSEPVKLVTRLTAIRGPIGLEAHFENGSILAELVGFDPGSGRIDDQPALVRRSLDKVLVCLPHPALL
jgi:hypothetical protein